MDDIRTLQTAKLVDQAKEFYENKQFFEAIDSINEAILNEEYGSEMHLYCLALKGDFLYYQDEDEEAFDIYM